MLNSCASIGDLRQIFFREVSLYLVYSLAALHCSFAVVFSYMDATIHYERFINNNNKFFLKIPDSVAIVIKVFIVAAILFNQNVIWMRRNFRIKTTPENPLIVHFICLPLLIFATVGLILLATCHIFCLNTVMPIKLITIVVLCFSTIILLLNINGTTDTGECWALNFSNCLAICLCISNLIGIAVQALVMLHAAQFANFFGGSMRPFCLGQSHGGSFIHMIHQTLENMHLYFLTCDIIMAVTLTLYLINPLKRNLRALEQKLNHNLSSFQCLMINDKELRFATFIDVVFNATILVILIFPPFVTDGYVDIAKIVVSNTKLGLTIAVTLYIFQNIPYWFRIPRLDKINIFNEIILWIGMVGELIDFLTHVFGVVHNIYKIHAMSVPLFVLECALKLIHLMLQTSLMVCINRRDFGTPQNKYKLRNRYFNPFLNLIVLNVIFIIQYLLHFYNDLETTNYIWKRLFDHEVAIGPHPLMALYRCFCILMLVHTIW